MGLSQNCEQVMDLLKIVKIGNVEEIVIEGRIVRDKIVEKEKMISHVNKSVIVRINNIDRAIINTTAY